MQYAAGNDQEAILEAVAQLLEQYAGAERAIQLFDKQAYDTELDAALEDGGFAAVASAEETGFLEAALISESISQAAGTVAYANGALVAPGVTGGTLRGPVALCRADAETPVRFGAQARSLLVLDGEGARVVELGAGDAEPVASTFGYPMGRISREVRGRGDAIGPGSGERLLAFWRVALAVEAVGAMQAALDVSVTYLKDRRQFGRAIASFQAVQHRLAACAVRIEGSRWLAREAAWHAPDPELSASAAAYTLAAATDVASETHQLQGAIGFTKEHDLHVWTMRLQALRLEVRGVAAHRRAVAATRWNAA